MKGAAPLVTVISLLISLLLIDLCPSSSSWVTRHNFPPFGQCYYHEALWVVGTRGGSSDGGANSTSDELFQPPVQSSSSIIMDDRLETKENKYTNIIHSTATGKEQEEPTADGPFQVTNKAHNAAAATSNVQPTLSVHQPEQNSCTMNGSCSIVVDRKMKEKYVRNRRCCPQLQRACFFSKCHRRQLTWDFLLPSNLVPTALVATTP